ncbi:MAG: hypothetical protein ACTS73_06575 [Arsenophonus sp. NEOnobi-MAG3]
MKTIEVEEELYRYIAKLRPSI